MHTGKGQIVELILEDGSRYLRVSCSPNLVPSPGQYLLAGDASDAPLPVLLFHTDSAPQGFIAAISSASIWNPGLELDLRGPLGRGLTLPVSARKVGLIAWDDSPARLKGLIRLALHQSAAVVLLCHSNPEHLPDEVEVQPISALHEVLEWADYLAFDVKRANLNQLMEQCGKSKQLSVRNVAQVLIQTPMPCGGVAECGVCAVTLRTGWRLACTDGPVFDWKELA